MQNTYQDLITEIQSKNPEISPKLEGGKKFKFVTDFKPAGDQPEAIKQLISGSKIYIVGGSEVVGVVTQIAVSAFDT